MKFMVIRGHYMGIICEKRKPEAFIFNMNVHIMPTNVHEYFIDRFWLNHFLFSELKALIQGLRGWIQKGGGSNDGSPPFVCYASPSPSFALLISSRTCPL